MCLGRREEIVGEGGFNAASAFAGVQGAMAPQAAAPVGGVPVGHTPAPQAAGPVVGAPVGHTPAPQAVPTPTPVSTPAPVAPVKVYVHTDPAVTKEQYQAHDAAWTEDMLVSQGKGRWEEQAAPALVSAPVSAPVAAAPTGVQPAHDFLQQPGVVPQ